MHTISAHELAFWISLGVGGGVGLAVAISLSLLGALRSPDEPDA